MQAAPVRPVMVRSSRYRQTLVQRHTDSTHASIFTSLDQKQKAIELTPVLHTKVCPQAP
jgi:hypothetical protein